MLVPVRFVWKLIGCLIFVFCAFWYARSHFYRDPGSAFFDKTRAYEKQYSLHRSAQVQRFIEARAGAHGNVLEAKAGSNPSLCVTLNSVKREHTYAKRKKTTIGSLLHGLTPQERTVLRLSVLVAETDRNAHPSWHQKWIHRAVDDMYTYNVSVPEQAHLKYLQRTGRYAEKGVFDYTYALGHCYDTETPYIGVFEDDILLAHGWLVRTLLGLREISKGSPWLFMRLFNQERSTGWARRDIGGNNELWIIVGIALCIALPVVLTRRLRWRLALIYLDVGTVGLVVLLLNPTLVILFFQCGKASLLPPSAGIFAESFGCCSQAMIFPRAQVPALMEFLQERRSGQIDLLLDEWARQADLVRYALYPVQAQHIGLGSSRKTQEDEAQAIWSMAYEDLEPETLSRTHSQMVDEYYGLPQ